MALSAAAVLVAAAAPTRDENRARVRQMPLEWRQALSRNLAEFDRLPTDLQAALRDLDRRIQECEPGVRERYLEVLRRYDLWVRGLPPAARKRLAEAPPESRLVLVRGLLDQSDAPLGERLDPILARYSSLHPYPIIDQVYWIRSWFSLDAAQKRAVQGATGERRREELERYGQQNGVVDDRPLLLRRYQRDVSERLQDRPPQGKIFEAMKPQAKEALTRRLQEARFLQEIQPEPVPAAQLSQFAADLPGWLLESLDPLPPEAARLRLALLYRLAFPPDSAGPGGPDTPPAHPEGKPGQTQEGPETPPTASPRGVAPF